MRLTLKKAATKKHAFIFFVDYCIFVTNNYQVNVTSDVCPFVCEQNGPFGTGSLVCNSEEYTQNRARKILLTTAQIKMAINVDRADYET